MIKKALELLGQPFSVWVENGYFVAEVKGYDRVWGGDLNETIFQSILTAAKQRLGEQTACELVNEPEYSAFCVARVKGKFNLSLWKAFGRHWCSGNGIDTSGLSEESAIAFWCYRHWEKTREQGV